jgi:hypothetical protein
MKQKIIAEKIKSSRRLVESVKPGGKKALAVTGNKKLKEVAAQVRVASELKARVDGLKKQLKAKKEELAQQMIALAEGRKALKKALKKAKPPARKEQKESKPIPSITITPQEPEKKVARSVSTVKKQAGKTANATVKRKPKAAVKKKPARKV